MIALSVGVWENAQARRHNRLSVLPSLEFVAELHTEGADSSARGEILVVNEGVGPAVIDRLSIRVAEPGGAARSYPGWDAAAPALERLGVRLTGRAELGRGTVMGVGRERALIRFRPTETQAPGAAADVFARLLDHLSITILYHSIYGDEHRDTPGGG